MAKPEWGIKRLCQSCGAKYYDFRAQPIVCPKCGATFDPDALLRSRRVRTGTSAKPEEPVAKPKPAAAAKKSDEEEQEEEELVDDKELDALEEDDADDADSDSDDEDDEDVIEDASELGEDEDDMAEVVVEDGDDDDDR